MSKNVNAPRGMRDILPEDKTRREWALGTIRRVYRAHGFDEIEAPALENYDRLHAGLGGDNEKLSFSVLKRGIKPEEIAAAAKAEDAEQLADLGLRFDLTVPLSRYYATNHANLGPVLKAIHIGPVWRAERPQKGRYRQFVQADIDIIGEDTLVAEAELVTATSAALAELGLKDITIRLNDRRVLSAMLESAGFDAADHGKVLITVDKLDKIGIPGVSEELQEYDPEAAAKLTATLESVIAVAGDDGIEVSAEAIAKALPGLTDSEGIKSVLELGSALNEGLPEGVTIIFDPTLVRGMGYYTGTIFEVAHPASGSSVGGGGRYDGLVGRFLGRDVPAVGFSIGFERIIDLVRAPEADSALVALIYDRDVPLTQLIALKRELVASGRSVRLEKRQKNMKTLLSRVHGAGIREYAFVRAEHTSTADLEFKELTN